MVESEVLWSILILTISGRAAKFRRLLDNLLPQAEAHPGVEVVALYTHNDIPVPEAREAMVRDARGEWLCFVDDDDSVPEDYVPVIAGAFRNDIQAVGFNVLVFRNGELYGPAYHGLQYGPAWHEDGQNMYRDWTLLNPVRTAIAQQASFLRGRDVGEDFDFRSQVIEHIHRDAYIPQFMYLYRWETEDSRQAQHGFTVVPPTYAPRPQVNSPAFRWHEKSAP